MSICSSLFWLIEYKQTKNKNECKLGRDQTIHELFLTLMSNSNMHFFFQWAREAPLDARAQSHDCYDL